MPKTVIDVLPIGLYEENSYVVHDHGHVLLIDPGRYPKLIAEKIGAQETVDAIVLTHGHHDHTGAVDDLADQYQCPVYLHPGDLPLVEPGNRNQSVGGDASVYHAITPLAEGALAAGTFPLSVYPTPGHTAGSVLVQYKNHLFTGDTLFAGDIGRTDLFSGSEEDMQKSLQFIRTLPSDLIVHPGHGPASTIGEEKASNPYLR